LNIYNLEQYILFLLIKHSTLDLRELKLKVLRVEPTLSEKMLSYKLSLLKESGFVEFVEEQSDEYRRCLERHSDKRIKNIARYCKQRHPVLIKIRITDSGKVKYLHNCFCLNYCYSRNTETALINMVLCEELADLKTRPPMKCTC